MGRCASHCSLPGDHNHSAGFHQVLLTVLGPPGLPALILPDHLLSSAQTCCLFAASCAGQVSSPSTSSLFFCSLSLWVQSAAVDQSTLWNSPPLHICCSFSRFQFFFFLSQHIWTLDLDKWTLCCVSHTRTCTHPVFFWLFVKRTRSFVSYGLGHDASNLLMSPWIFAVKQWMSFFNLAWHFVEQMAAPWVAYVTPLEVQSKINNLGLVTVHYGKLALLMSAIYWWHTIIEHYLSTGVLWSFGHLSGSASSFLLVSVWTVKCSECLKVHCNLFLVLTNQSDWDSLCPKINLCSVPCFYKSIRSTNKDNIIFPYWNLYFWIFFNFNFYG